MQQHIYYTKYALQFADMQIPELVTVFNQQVGNTGWTGMRAYHDQALIEEFQRRGIDVSAVYDGKAHRLKALIFRTQPLPSALAGAEVSNFSAVLSDIHCQSLSSSSSHFFLL